MSENVKKIITYKVDGSAFQDGISLYELNTCLTEFQSIMEKSYLTLTDQYRMTKDDRKKFKLISREFREGSFITDMEIIVQGVQMAFPIFTAVSAGDLWSLTKDTFDFLKLVYSAKKENQPIKIDVGNNNSDITLNIVDEQHIYSGTVLPTAQNSISHYKNLTNLIESGNVDSIEVVSENEAGFILSKNDSDLFNVPKKIKETPLNIKGEIFRFDKYKKAGKIRVYSNQVIAEGDYSFSVENDIKKVMSYLPKKNVSVKVFAEYIDDPLEGEKNIFFKTIRYCLVPDVV